MMTPITVECNESCTARNGKNCMWRIDDDLIKRSEKKLYRKGMCPVLLVKIDEIKKSKK